MDSVFIMLEGRTAGSAVLVDIKNHHIFHKFIPNRYRCSQHKDLGCKVYVTEKSEGVYVSNGREHCHPNLEMEIVNVRFRSECRRVASNENISLKACYDKAKINFPLADVPFRSIERSMQRDRQIVRQLISSSVQDFDPLRLPRHRKQSRTSKGDASNSPSSNSKRSRVELKLIGAAVAPGSASSPVVAPSLDPAAPAAATAPARPVVASGPASSPAVAPGSPARPSAAASDDDGSAADDSAADGSATDGSAADGSAADYLWPFDLEQAIQAILRTDGVSPEEKGRIIASILSSLRQIPPACRQ